MRDSSESMIAHYMAKDNLPMIRETFGSVLFGTQVKLGMCLLPNLDDAAKKLFSSHEAQMLFLECFRKNDWETRERFIDILMSVLEDSDYERLYNIEVQVLRTVRERMNTLH